MSITGLSCDVSRYVSMIFSIVADHAILSGTGRISRKSEHFEGLLKAIRDENSTIDEQHVEKRDLTKYEDVT